MCGRFTLRTPAETISSQFNAEVRSGFVLSPRYNIAPSQGVVTVRQGDNARFISKLLWGLIPHWMKEPRADGTINARSETAAEKPMYREAFAERRCLIIADGWYEWRREKDYKQPYLFEMEDSRPFAFAGLWEKWHGWGDAENIESCSILTTAASSFTKPYHHRMPCILCPVDYDSWLNPRLNDPAAIQKMIYPYAGNNLTVRAVNRYVNNARNEGPGCLDSA